MLHPEEEEEEEEEESGAESEAESEVADDLPAALGVTPHTPRRPRHTGQVADAFEHGTPLPRAAEGAQKVGLLRIDPALLGVAAALLIAVVAMLRG